MKKYEVLVNIIKDSITFSLINFGIFLFLMFLKLKGIKSFFEVKYKDIISNLILKKRLKKNLNNFLSIIKKLLNKKKRLIKAFK